MKNFLTLALTALFAVAMTSTVIAQDCGCSQPMMTSMVAPAPAVPMAAAPIQSYVPSTPMYNCSSCNSGIATVAYNEITPTQTPVVTSAPIQATPVSTYNSQPVTTAPSMSYAQPATTWTQPTTGCCGNTGTTYYSQPNVSYGTQATTVTNTVPATTTVPTTTYAAPATTTWNQAYPVSTGYYSNGCDTCSQNQRGLFRGRILNRR